MKKFTKYALFFAVASLFTTGFTACGSDDNNDSATADSTGVEQKLGESEDSYLGKVLNQYVDQTICATYADMASNVTTFYERMKTLRDAVEKGSATQAQVDSACASWKRTRACYEKSEAFLLGAASDYDIDPHIDTWPLSLTDLHDKLASNTELQKYITDDDAANIDKAHADLNQSLLGFHSVEFIIFRDGAPRKVANFNSKYDNYNDQVDFTDISPLNELKFGVTVAGDLMYSIYQLEVCWSGGTAEHKAALEALEWKTTMPLVDRTYGENMKTAGQSGSLYTSVKAAVSAILIGDQGCVGICDEVGQTKLGKPYGLNTNSENAESDPSYIESPYSWNSLTDFWDNIQSIKNTWYGGYTANGTYSFHNYFAKMNAELGKKVEDAINNAQAKIKACPTPFVKNYHNAQVLEAINACDALTDVLTEANTYIDSKK